MLNELMEASSQGRHIERSPSLQFHQEPTFICGLHVISFNTLWHRVINIQKSIIILYLHNLFNHRKSFADILRKVLMFLLW